MHGTDFTTLFYTKRAAVVEITLNRPDVLNALNITLYRELGAAIAAADADSEVRVVVITGAGRAFSTGGDLKQANAIGPDDHRSFAEASSTMFRGILTTNKVVIAKVNGIAQAGGLLIVAACDLAVASARARFRCPEALVGLWEPYAPALLTPQLGVRITKRLLLASEELSAEEAQQVGLVSHVAPHDELERITDRLVDQVLAGGPQALAMFKRLINAHVGAFDTQDLLKALSSDELAEGLAAFAGKRKPAW